MTNKSTEVIVDHRSETQSERRRRELTVRIDRRVGQRREFRSPVPQEFQTRDASIVMLALLEGLADNVLGGDMWAESIQSAFVIATEQYGVKPEFFMSLVDRIMEVKDTRTKDIE